jgi:hypothetical protein
MGLHGLLQARLYHFYFYYSPVCVTLCSLVYIIVFTEIDAFHFQGNFLRSIIVRPLELQSIFSSLNGVTSSYSLR